MKYEELIERLDKLEEKIIDVELEKSRLTEAFIEELEFQSGDFVSDGLNKYEVLAIGFNFEDQYLYVEAMAVEMNGGPVPEDPDHWDHRRVYSICGEDAVNLKLIEKNPKNQKQ